MAPTIAVIEDETEVLGLLCDMLRMDGYAIEPISHPSAVTSLTVEPDLFVIDLMLPGTNGLEVARQLRSQSFPYTPMVALSASRMMLEQAAGSGLFQTTMLKPFDIVGLLAEVERLTCRGATK